MSNEIKMSDVWNQLPTYGVYDNATVNGAQLPNGLYGMLFSNKEPAEAIVHAINTHDQHVARIAELEGALKTMVSVARGETEYSLDELDLYAYEQLLEQSK